MFGLVFLFLHWGKYAAYRIEIGQKGLYEALVINSTTSFMYPDLVGMHKKMLGFNSLRKDTDTEQ